MEQKNVDPVLLGAARMLGLLNVRYSFHVVLPASIPYTSLLVYKLPLPQAGPQLSVQRWYVLMKVLVGLSSWA